jgi:hypothetical protein
MYVSQWVVVKQVSVSIEEASQQDCTGRKKKGKREQERKIEKRTSKDATIDRYRTQIKSKGG